jgi:hypothetical protein
MLIGPDVRGSSVAAVDNGLIKGPTRGVRNPRRKDADSFLDMLANVVDFRVLGAEVRSCALLAGQLFSCCNIYEALGSVVLW